MYMNNVWKIGSRWSVDGHKDTSVLDIFRKHNVVFIGSVHRHRLANNVTVGDLIAISDGNKVVAMGFTTSNPKPITQLGIAFSDEERMRFDYKKCVIGCKVAFTDLKDDLHTKYRIGSFHEVVTRSDEFRRLYVCNKLLA